MGKGLENFAKLQDLLVPSSHWLGISSTQLASLGTSLSGKFVQFSSVYRNQVRLFSSFSSFQFIQFSPRTLPTLARIDLSDWARLRLGSGSVQSIESQIVCEEQRSSSRSPPPTHTHTQRKSQPASPEFVVWVECWLCLPARPECGVVSKKNFLN